MCFSTNQWLPLWLNFHNPINYTSHSEASGALSGRGISLAVHKTGPQFKPSAWLEVIKNWRTGLSDPLMRTLIEFILLVLSYHHPAMILSRQCYYIIYKEMNKPCPAMYSFSFGCSLIRRFKEMILLTRKWQQFAQIIPSVFFFSLSFQSTMYKDLSFFFFCAKCKSTLGE